jgi:hypothetical protein
MFNSFNNAESDPLDWRALQVEPTGSNDFGPCSCCGNMSRTVWGFVHSPASTVAAYFVQWTLNNPGHGANFDLIIGKWGNQAIPKDRQAVSLEYRVIEQQGSFMVIDPTMRPVATNSLVGSALKREEVVGQSIAQNVFAIVDAVFMKDERIREIQQWS